MYKNNVDICNSANDNYRLGGTRLHSMALGCILWHLVEFQGTRLHSKAFGYITRHSAPFPGTQLQLE
jgi:hypothetical protein